MSEPQSVMRVNGEAYTDLPQHLYIPPGALTVYLNTFEGPLDLLLYLIRRHNLDVLDIPMADITCQYMDYLGRLHSTRLDLAAEYLLMAALLIEIKSRMLLPRPLQSDETAEAEDPRAELVRRLLEYEQMKIAAQLVENKPREGRDFEAIAIWSEAAEKRLPQVQSADLRAAWLGIVARAGAHRHHAVEGQELSVREAMGRILGALQNSDLVEFSRLFDTRVSIPQLVVTFLAILELARERLLEITQATAFASIYIRLAHADR